MAEIILFLSLAGIFAILLGAAARRQRGFGGQAPFSAGHDLRSRLLEISSLPLSLIGWLVGRLRRGRPRPSILRPSQAHPIKDALAESSERAERGDLEGAERILVQAAARHPDEAALYLQLGILALKRKGWQDAREALTQTLHLQPDNGTAHANLGLALFHLRNFERAAKHLTRACEIDGSIASRFANLAYCLEALGKIEQAAEAAEKARKLDEQPKYARLLERLTEKLKKGKKRG